MKRLHLGWLAAFVVIGLVVFALLLIDLQSQVATLGQEMRVQATQTARARLDAQAARLQVEQLILALKRGGR